LPDGTDFNTVIKSGFYKIKTNNTNAAPNSDWGQLIVGRNEDTIVQMSFVYNSTIDYYVRTGEGIGGTPAFTQWVKMWNSGNDGAGSGLDADTVDGVQGALLGVGGQGYSWVDETANRALGTTYTNTYGKPIIIVVGSYTTAGVYELKLLASINGGSPIAFGIDSTPNGHTSPGGMLVIGNGDTYNITTNHSTTLVYWAELK